MVWTETAAGLLGGASGIFVTHPLDTIRVRAQVAKTNSISYSSIIKKILKDKGYRGFYSGVTPPVVFRGLSFSVNRTVYAATKKHTNNPLVLGGVAGFFQTFLDCPTYLLKCRAQVTSSKVKETVWNYLKLAHYVVKNEGFFHGFYTGFTSTVIFSTGSYAAFYFFYDNLRDQDVSAPISGMVACVLSWPLFYPFDVLRTRIQCTQKKSFWSKRYFTFRYFAAQMWRTPIKTWFPGLSLTLVRGMPRFLICMSVTEHSRNLLEKQTMQKH